MLFVHVRNPEKNRIRVQKQFFETLKACCDRPDAGLACARVYDAGKRLTSDIRMGACRIPSLTG